MPFVRIEGAGGQNTWVHLPIPTPSTNNGTRTKAEAALVSFHSRNDTRAMQIEIVGAGVDFIG